MTGPAFRFLINDEMIVHVGIGINMYITLGVYKEYNEVLAERVNIERGSFAFGFGTDLALRYKLTKGLILNIGTVLTFDLANFIDIQASNPALDTQGWARNYFGFAARPYISIGANLYWENSRLVR